MRHDGGGSVKGAFFLAALLAASLTTTGCNASTEDPVAIPGAALAVDDPFSGGYPTYDDPASGIRIVFGTPDIAIGTPRISFALFDGDGLVSEPAIEAIVRHYPDGAGKAPLDGHAVSLTFRAFPDGGRGIYTGYATFDRPGLWAIEVPVNTEDSSATVTFPIEVADQTVAPDIGESAPTSQNRTVADESDIHLLTTATEPDARLYERTISDVIDTGLPFVIVFASPAFCTNALCGPQVEVLSSLADDYGGQAAFIHVDLYENPDEIRGDLSVARRTPVLDEWGIHTDEWTFVVDAAGIVRARFEGFAAREEVEPALIDVIADGP